MTESLRKDKLELKGEVTDIIKPEFGIQNVLEENVMAVIALSCGINYIFESYVHGKLVHDDEVLRVKALI